MGGAYRHRADHRGNGLPARDWGHGESNIPRYIASMPSIIGPIIRLQIQRGALKVGEKGAKRYLTDSIQAADRLWISRDGVSALEPGGETLDAHHRAHPLKKNDDGLHGVSVGFTGHYRAMQERFGAHMVLGCAGENIIVEAPRRLAPEEVAAGFLILDASGREKGHLLDVAVAHPCKPFTGFSLRNLAVAPDVFQASLRFLDGGMRGFYCTWTSEPATVDVGDVVAV